MNGIIMMVCEMTGFHKLKFDINPLIQSGPGGAKLSWNFNEFGWLVCWLVGHLLLVLVGVWVGWWMRKGGREEKWSWNNNGRRMDSEAEGNKNFLVE